MVQLLGAGHFQLNNILAAREPVLSGKSGENSIMLPPVKVQSRCIAAICALAVLFSVNSFAEQEANRLHVKPDHESYTYDLGNQATVTGLPDVTPLTSNRLSEFG